MRLAVFGVALMAVVGCGGSYATQARRGLYIAGETFVTVDAIVAPRYTSASDEAVESTDTLLEYHRLMAEWDQLALTLRMIRASLLHSERMLDEYEETGKRLGWLASVGCTIELFENLFRDLRDVGIDPPEGVATTAQVLKPFGGFCNERVEE